MGLRVLCHRVTRCWTVTTHEVITLHESLYSICPFYYQSIYKIGQCLPLQLARDYRQVMETFDWYLASDMIKDVGYCRRGIQPRLVWLADHSGQWCFHI